MRIPFSVLCLSLLAVISPMVASAALISNGGFESPALAPAGLSTRTGTELTGWTTTGTLLQWTNQVAGFTNIHPSEGVQFVTLQSANTLATISQDISTVPGTPYQVTFDLYVLAGTVSDTGSAQTLTLGVAANTASPTTQDFTTNAPAVANGGANFLTTSPASQTFLFTATGSTTTLSFQNKTLYSGDQNFGTSLDKITVSAVPEPASVMAMGVLGIALIARRKSRA